MAYLQTVAKVFDSVGIEFRQFSNAMSAAMPQGRRENNDMRNANGYTIELCREGVCEGDDFGA